MCSAPRQLDQENKPPSLNPLTGAEPTQQSGAATLPEDNGSDQGKFAPVKSIFPMQWVLPPEKKLLFEEVCKRMLFANLAVPGIIAFSVFGTYHLTHGNKLEGYLDLLASLCLVLGLLELRRMNKGLVIYRIIATFLGLMFLFLAVKGGVEGNKLLWLFSYPLIAFYTLGIAEGLIWTGALYLFSMGILFFPLENGWIHAYSLEFKIRFSVAFLLVTSITWIYESARGKYQTRLENEQQNLLREKQKLAEMTRTVQSANRALTRSEQRLKQAQSIARVGNFEYDPHTNRLWGSEEVLRILDLDRSSPPLCLNDLKERTPDFYAFIAGFETRKDKACKFRLSSSRSAGQDQEEKMVYARAEHEPGPDPSYRAIIGVVQDITALHKAEEEKKELQARLDRSQKMEALGLLAGGVAHDLNNVLTGIVSYPDMLLRQYSNDSDLQRPLSVIRDSGQKAAAIVQDLLTLTRRGVISMENLNLNDLIDEYLASPELNKLQSYHPHVEITVDKHDRLSNIHGSAVHLKKSLMNLVSNAAEALTERGQVRIFTRNRSVARPIKGYTEISAGDYVVLGVEDNGSGIRPEDQGRIFEPFFTKKKMGRSGTGLGLAVVWGTVEDHHGHINLCSAMGQGTLIELYLPGTGDDIKHTDKTAPSQDYQGNGELILVVDDMQPQREITQEMLGLLGYRVETAPSGEAAIAYLQDHPVDLVVLDMIMDPGIDGLETYIRLRALNPAQKTLIVSGFSETKRVKKAQQLGAGAYVKKPFNLQTIGLAIRRELNA